MNEIEIQAVKAKNDILDIAIDLLDEPLHHKGNGNFVCKCPFHDEKTGSFVVSRSKQIYKCFGCGEGGDVIQLVMKCKSMDFKQAVEYLGGGKPTFSHDNKPIIKAQEKPKKIGFIPFELVEKSADNISEPSTLKNFFYDTFGRTKTNAVWQSYKVGRTRNKSTIFFQIDLHGRCRTGKVIDYMDNGHRNHDARTYWVHTEMMKKGGLPSDWQLSQCLFGEHLLNDPTKAVALVEAEKTALIGAILHPSSIWVAVGGEQNFKANILQPLKGRTVTAFPDLHPENKSFDCWFKVAEELNAQGFKISVSNFWADLATDEQKARKLDIGDLMIDYALSHPSQEVLFQKMCDRNFRIKAICDRLDLSVSSVK